MQSFLRLFIAFYTQFLMFKKLNMEIGTKLSLGGNKLDNNLKS